MAEVYYPAKHILTGLQCALSGDDQLSVRVTDCPDREGYKIWIGYREAHYSYLTHIENFYDIAKFVHCNGHVGTHPAYAERTLLRELLDKKDRDRISQQALEHYRGRGLVLEECAPIPPGFAELSVTFYKAAVRSMIERAQKDIACLQPDDQATHLRKAQEQALYQAQQTAALREGSGILRFTPAGLIPSPCQKLPGKCECGGAISKSPHSNWCQAKE